MNSLTLYEYSQLFTIIETLLFGLSLMLIGNKKVRNDRQLKVIKWVATGVLLIVATFTCIQFIFKMSINYPSVDTALNITMLYIITILLAIAFIPIANEAHLTRMRSLITLGVFITCDILIWLSTAFESSIAMLLTFTSLSLYFIELVRILLVFFSSYKNLKKNRDKHDIESETHYTYLNLLVQCIGLLSLFALLYVFLVLLSNKAKAFHNFAMLFAWGFLYLSILDPIINHNNLNFSESIQTNKNTKDSATKTSPQVTTAATSPYPNLGAKVERWVASGEFCQQGITMVQIAELFGTNRTYLSRYINSQYGCNFNTWLTRLRINEAKRKMTDSPTLSLEEIATHVGFSTKSHFIASFKSIEGITPGAWREQQDIKD